MRKLIYVIPLILFISSCAHHRYRTDGYEKMLEEYQRKIERMESEIERLKENEKEELKDS